MFQNPHGDSDYAKKYSKLSAITGQKVIGGRGFQKSGDGSLENLLLIANNFIQKSINFWSFYDKIFVSLSVWIFKMFLQIYYLFKIIIFISLFVTLSHIL